jgi:hypothetical protein
MKVRGTWEYRGDIDAPYVTLTLSAIEALNLECAVRAWLRGMDEDGGVHPVFVQDAGAMLKELKDINKASEDYEKENE